MKIQFMLDWGKTPKFKSKQTGELFSEYVQRISRFGECCVLALDKQGKKAPGTALWICHRESKTGPLSSEALSQKIEKLANGGVRTLQIVIGGPDGFTPKDIELLKPDLVWSFGPMTLPHELAAVVAAEQVYRAHTILKRLPYHSDHR